MNIVQWKFYSMITVARIGSSTCIRHRITSCTTEFIRLSLSTLFNDSLCVVLRHELWKPTLRALMESDMKAVSDGRKSKPQVLGTALEGMKSLFISVRLPCPLLCYVNNGFSVSNVYEMKHLHDLLSCSLQARTQKEKLLDAMGIFFER